MRRHLILLISVGTTLACSEGPAEEFELTDSHRVAIADTIRGRVYAFAEAQENHERLCEDPSEVRDYFTYPDGRMLLASDTTLSFTTQSEWEANGLPVSYWCSIESLELRIDSVVVHVLTPDVAVASWPHHFARVMKTGERDEARSNIFETFLRTETGWKATSGFAYFKDPVR